MGEGDLGCASDAELRESVAKIRRGCEEYKSLWPLQLEFMEQHDQLAPGVFRTAYSDGSEIITNYNAAAYAYRSKTVAPMDYLLVNKSHQPPGR